MPRPTPPSPGSSNPGGSNGTPRRRDSSPMSQFIDQGRRSLRSFKSKAISLASDSNASLDHENNQQKSNARLDMNTFGGPSSGSATANLPPGATAADYLSQSTSSASIQRNDAIFEQIAYLGCSKINDPISEPEMLQIIASFNQEKSHQAVNVSMMIPTTSSGTVRLFESDSKVEISSFPIHRIRFCARGQPSSPERGCFALSFTQFNSGTSPLHQCHVFRCQVPEAAGRALLCFANAFRNNEPPNSTGPSDQPGVEEDYQFEAFLEIKEEDAKKGFTVCPVERNCFKLRRDREKRVVIVLRQTTGPRPLNVKKCFGLLLAAGRNLRQADMHLLDMQSMSEGQPNSGVYVVEAAWNPSAQNFEVLNTETPKETRVFMTIAVDMILSGIDEPIRFNIEGKARIFQQFERFWYIPRKAITEQYFLTIKMTEDATTSEIAQNPSPDHQESLKDQPSDGPTPDQLKSDKTTPEAMNGNNSTPYKVVKFESVTERERSMSKISLDGRSPTKMPTQLIHPADDDESDSDEPLLSGSGDVNRECSDDILAEWRALIVKWKEEPEKRPAELNSLMNLGIPDLLRGEVWQLLTKVHNDLDLAQTYRMLLEKECPSEQVILRDIHRTFPAHDFFKESNGIGQEALYKISKAYSLYDEEVSYCQGLSFLAAALLLHMPEEKAFCVLIKIMFDYDLRDLFKLGFDTLHLRFYQLQRLIETYEHELYIHFYNTGVETHMYASQWFLTLFTAKFPLQMVFFIIDLFLSEGVNTIFHISLALLQDSKKDLLQLDFEGILKYFRVTLPRKYRTENNARELIRNAVKLKISHKRLSKYEKEYHQLKQKELESLDPLERVERENFRFKETILRLERENDDLAHELVTSKIELRNKLDMTEDQLESTVTAIERKSRECQELREECSNLKKETEMVKNMCREEVSRLDDEISTMRRNDKRSQSVLEQYKKICTDLGNTFEQEKKTFEEQKKSIVNRVSTCPTCSEAVSEWAPESPKTKHELKNGVEYPQVNGVTDNDSTSTTGGTFHIVELMDQLEAQEEYIRQVELELAQTKLALVESQCHNQDLAHQMSTSMTTSDSNDLRPAWFKKTISSIRDVGTSLKNQQSSPRAGHARSNSNVSVDNR
ncbi:rab-GTPase-TBC domain-containing protein [Ditylenchus destructor]|nr:rab-GTPase-TBC domain-containing protein [Ditylenchus destructor]